MSSYSTIQLQKASMAYGKKLLFLDVELRLNETHAYALVGANGTGKSTLFRVLSKEEELTDGEIQIPNNATIGWLKQDQFRYENTPILDIVIQGKQQLWDVMVEREALFENEHWSEADGHRLAALEELFAHLEGYTAKAEAQSILYGLGIQQEYFHRPLSALSGGYKLRVLLAQTLFQKPSILLLDEPTNHLDILSIRWLEKFLKTSFKGLLVLISHDVDFINHVTNRVLDIDYGEIRLYQGPYSKFLEQKKQVEEQKQLEIKSAEHKIIEMQRFIDRFGAKASKASQARARQKMIDKIEVPDIKHSSRISPQFMFHPERPSGKEVLKVDNLSMAFKEKQLFQGFNFSIKRGEKVAIMGVNGIGKSTFMKLIAGRLAPTSGSISWGHEARVSYFSQDHHEELNASQSVLEWLTNETRGASSTDIRKVLGRVLFSKDDVDKDVLSISGGEAARVLLAKVMLEKPNVILLDEPTNHMDLESIEALSHALSEFDGTVIAVSHNRHFTHTMADRILYLRAEGKPQDFRGKYAEFEAQLED